MLTQREHHATLLMERTNTFLVVTLKGVFEEKEVISGEAIRHHLRQVVSHHATLCGVQVDTLLRHIYCLHRDTSSHTSTYVHVQCIGTCSCQS